MSDLEKIKQLEQRVISLEKELKDLKVLMSISNTTISSLKNRRDGHKILDLIENNKQGCKVDKKTG